MKFLLQSLISAFYCKNHLSWTFTDLKGEMKKYAFEQERNKGKKMIYEKMIT